MLTKLRDALLHIVDNTSEVFLPPARKGKLPGRCDDEDGRVHKARTVVDFGDHIESHILQCQEERTLIDQQEPVVCGAE
jgi:hypothetical protein